MLGGSTKFTLDDCFFAYIAVVGILFYCGSSQCLSDVVYPGRQRRCNRLYESAGKPGMYFRRNDTKIEGTVRESLLLNGKKGIHRMVKNKHEW